MSISAAKSLREHFSFPWQLRRMMFIWFVQTLPVLTRTLIQPSLTGLSEEGELQRNAANICNFIIGTNAMKRLCGEADEIEDNQPS